MNLATLAQAVAGSLLHPARKHQEVTGVCADSRLARPGDLFICLKGEVTDGHQHATQAVKAGAVAVLAQQDPFEGEVHASALLTPVILVPDTLKALGALGHYWRQEFGGKVIGITGTAGKTTVKEMLGHVLAGHAKTAKNPLNLNTQVGLPLSLLATDGKEKFWVMEAGISKSGDMDELGPILEPDLAVILNVGPGHTLGLGEKGVAWHKTRLLTYLKSDGAALVSADYPDLVKESRMACPTAGYFSCTGRPVAYRASYAGVNSLGQGMFRLWLDGASLDVACPLRGPYAAENVIAVAATAHLMGLSQEEIANGLASAPLPRQRFNTFPFGAWTVIDDSYNANPLSCARMLEAAAEMAGEKPLVCVMGEMLELGDASNKEHEELGRHLAQAKAKAVFWIGGNGKTVQLGLEETVTGKHFVQLEQPEQFAAALAETGIHEGVILFKGSRGNKMERFVEAFKKNTNINTQV